MQEEPSHGGCRLEMWVLFLVAAELRQKLNILRVLLIYKVGCSGQFWG